MGEWETIQPTKKAPIEDLNSVEGFPAEQLPLSTDAEVTCGALDFVHYCKGNTAGMQLETAVVYCRELQFADCVT